MNLTGSRMREIRTYGLMRGCWPVRHHTAGWGLLDPHRVTLHVAPATTLPGRRRRRGSVCGFVARLPARAARRASSLFSVPSAFSLALTAVLFQHARSASIGSARIVRPLPVVSVALQQRVVDGFFGRVERGFEQSGHGVGRQDRARLRAVRRRQRDWPRASRTRSRSRRCRSSTSIPSAPARRSRAPPAASDRARRAAHRSRRRSCRTRQRRSRGFDVDVAKRASRASDVARPVDAPGCRAPARPARRRSSAGRRSWSAPARRPSTSSCCRHDARRRADAALPAERDRAGAGADGAFLDRAAPGAGDRRAHVLGA